MNPRFTFVAGVAVAFCLAVFGAIAAATAAPSLTWPAATELQLPSGAATAAGTESAQVSGVACPSAGSCVAVGGYNDTNGLRDGQAMVANQANGSWAPASELSLPSGAATLSGAQSALLSSVACTGVGACVAVGRYSDSSGGRDAMVATEAAGTWGQATGVTLPAGASMVQNAFLDGVACASAGNCVAVGSYPDATAGNEAMVATETGGTWAPATELVLPSGAAASAQNAELTSVSCASAGNCVAVGDYTDSASAVQPMVADETGGTWAQASELPRPSGAGSTAAATLDSVACTSAGNCVAVGAYGDASADHLAMIETETGGTWAATTLSLPTGAASGASVQDAGLRAVSCPSAGNCVSTGSYTDTNGVADYQAMTAAESGGAWAQATKLTLPSNATTKPGAQAATLSAVACTSDGSSCAAGGLYAGTNGSPDLHAMVLSTSAGGSGPTGPTGTSGGSGPTGSKGVAPNTVLTKATVSSAKHTAKFVFKATGTATGFQCALVRAAKGKHPKLAYRGCRSPASYRHLKVGSYTFYVRAVGPGGTDPTPAHHAFRIA